MFIKKRGFSLAELVLSIGLFALAVLTLLGLSLSISRTDSKALERSAGTLIANQVLGRTIAELNADSPAGARENFFSIESAATIWDKGELKNGHTDFFYSVEVGTVRDAGTGASLGNVLEGNRLKRVTVHVWWAGESSQTRQGSGQLEVFVSKLVSEAEVALAPTP